MVLKKIVKREDGDIGFQKSFEEIFLDQFRHNPDFRNKFSKLVLENQESHFPLSLLTLNNLSTLESVVKYLRENKHLCYKEMAKKLNRNPSALAVTYKQARTKHEALITEFDSSIMIPFAVFDRKELSVLECVIFYLQNQGRKQSEIARLIGKDPRTIWTIQSRIKKKNTLRNAKVIEHN